MTGVLRAAQNGRPRRLPMEPRPDEIARRRFRWRLFGAHRGEVRHALLEMAAALDRSRTAQTWELLEQRALRRSLGEASTTIRALQQQLMAAKAELMILETARTAALEVLRSGRRTARAIRQSVDSSR
jgi:hypothetical protein